MRPPRPPAPVRPAAPDLGPAAARRSRMALGRAGEDLAALYLEARGFRVLERGFRTRDGEIDLVAADDETVVFVEVKARSGTACGRPAEAVDGRKQRRLVRAARVWLHRHGATERPCRFDVVEILSRPGEEPTAHHIADAFQDG
jgi:putative endonuclease